MAPKGLTGAGDIADTLTPRAPFSSQWAMAWKQTAITLTIF